MYWEKSEQRKTQDFPENFPAIEWFKNLVSQFRKYLNCSEMFIFFRNLSQKMEKFWGVNLQIFLIEFFVRLKVDAIWDRMGFLVGLRKDRKQHIPMP